jgi:TolB-like protein/class 3 adenylate cyclase/Tfp pilus assembly protein PilF
MAEDRARRRLAAILAADVVGYSRLLEQDEAGTLAVLKERRRSILNPLVAEHHGRIVKVMGDGVLVEFGSAVDAVACAAELQKRMAAANGGLAGDRRIALRIGINLGDVVVEGGDLYGDGVVIGVRLQAMAEPGGICVSGAVHDQVGNKLPLAFEDLGPSELKNIAKPVQVFRVRTDHAIGARDEAKHQSKGTKPSIAVLPFANMSGDPEQEYFSDGITEDIITDLSKVSGLFVIARNSSFTYRGRAVKVQDVSRELGIRFVLEGSVRKAGNRVRIAVQLVDGTTGGHLWAERYDRDLTDIFAVQDEVTREIVSALALKLTQGEQRRLARKGTDNLEAYDYFLRGRQLQWRSSKAANDEARTLLERAIAIDPRFTAAYVTLACVHVLDFANRWRSQPEESQRAAEELAQRAVALDDDAPEAHWVLGLVYLGLRQLDHAMAEARKALALDPNLASAHSLLGQALHYTGHSQDAIESLTTAMRLDPHDRDLYLHFLAQAYFGLGRYEEAAANLRRRIVRKPDTDLSRVLLAACYGHLGRAEEAQALYQEVLQINPDYSFEHHRRGLPYKDPIDLERIAEGLRKGGVPV